MIDQDWRRRFKTFSERLGQTYAPVSETREALEAFKQINNSTLYQEPEYVYHKNSQGYSTQTNVNTDELINNAVDKALDVGILAAALFNK